MQCNARLIINEGIHNDGNQSFWLFTNHPTIIDHRKDQELLLMPYFILQRRRMAGGGEGEATMGEEVGGRATAEEGSGQR